MKADKPYNRGCILGVEVDGKDVPLKAMSEDQLDKLWDVNMGVASLGITAWDSSCTGCAKQWGDALFVNLFTLGVPALLGTVALGIGAAVLEERDRCKSHDLLIVSHDSNVGAVLVVDESSQYS